MSHLASPRDSTRRGRPGSSGAKTAMSTWIWPRRSDRLPRPPRPHPAPCRTHSARRQCPVTADSLEMRPNHLDRNVAWDSCHAPAVSPRSNRVQLTQQLESIMGRAISRVLSVLLVLVRFLHAPMTADTPPAAPVLPVLTTWLPQPCSYNCTNAATMQYDPGVGGAAVTQAPSASRVPIQGASTPSNLALQQHDRGIHT